MADEAATMRKRGWSIHSESVASETEELTPRQKQEFLALRFPTEDGDDELEVIEAPPPKRARGNDGGAPERGGGAEGETGDGFNSMEESETEEERKSTHDGSSFVPPHLLHQAKSKLSKWCARLFDPDRPRGLVEAPKVIPLNDEFLQAFGRREKEFDAKLGREIEIENQIEEVNQVVDLLTPTKAVAKEPVEGRKLRVANLPFGLTEEGLTKAVAVFGATEEVNLIMDKDSLKTQTPKNSGRAYVIFLTAADAENFTQRCKTIEGRPVRISVAAPQSTKKSSAGSSGGGMPRYWERNIGVKCYRCGEIGHMEKDCPNEVKPKPCPLCGRDDHDVRDCNKRQICFNCGIPGHVVRDCTYQRNLPKRVICGICFQQGHHRTNCPSRAHHAPTQDAKCLVCGKLGHFMCKDMKWFFGLNGVTCFNCGRSGHLGYDCDRPLLDQCIRNEELASQEIDRAEATSLADELNRQRDTNRGRGANRNSQKGHEDRNIYRPRPKTHSPPLRRGYNDGSKSRYNGNRGGYQQNRGPPPPQRVTPPQRGYSGGRGYNNNSNSNGRYHGGGNMNQGARGYGNSRGYRDHRY